MNDKSLVPADVIVIESCIGRVPGMTDEHYDLIGLALEHVGSTVEAVSICLTTDSGPSNEILASMLHSVETHLAIIKRIAENALQTNTPPRSGYDRRP